MKECIQRPANSFIKGVLEPLQTLRQRSKIESQDMIILVDSLNDAEYHKPDHGDSLAGFINRVLPFVPPWIKFVVTVNTSHVDMLHQLPLPQLVLYQREKTANSKTDNNRNVSSHLTSEISKHDKDILEYITYRAHVSNEIKANICMGCITPDPNLQRQFYHHLVKQSKGNLLYCKLILDLIQAGSLVLKTANFKILPVNLHEVLLLSFNLKFPR